MGSSAHFSRRRRGRLLSQSGLAAQSENAPQSLLCARSQEDGPVFDLIPNSFSQLDTAALCGFSSQVRKATEKPIISNRLHIISEVRLDELDFLPKSEQVLVISHEINLVSEPCGLSKM